MTDEEKDGIFPCGCMQPKFDTVEVNGRTFPRLIREATYCKDHEPTPEQSWGEPLGILGGDD